MFKRIGLKLQYGITSQIFAKFGTKMSSFLHNKLDIKI